jgi:hypothetical protein
MKNENKTSELNRKASAILKTLETKDLEQATGGIVLNPGGGTGDGCPHCGLLTSVE